MVTPLIYKDIFNIIPDRTPLIKWLNFKRKEKHKEKGKEKGKEEETLHIKTEYAMLIEWLNYMQQQKCNNIQQCCCCNITPTIYDGYIIGDTIYYDTVNHDINEINDINDINEIDINNYDISEYLKDGISLLCFK